MQPVLKTPPATRVVSPEDMKAHLRVDFDDDDALIDSYLLAAEQRLDGYAGILGRCLVTQTWEVGFADWAECLRLPFPDASAVSVSYIDPAGVEQTVAPGLYEVIEDALGAAVWFLDDFSDPSLSDDRAFPITVSVTAGYGNAAAVPGPLRVAIMMLADHFYHHRGVTGAGEEMPLGVKALVAPYRRRAA